MKAAFCICSLISSSSLNGKVPLRLTYTMTPTLHMSRDRLYPLLRSTSGAKNTPYNHIYFFSYRYKLSPLIFVSENYGENPQL